MANEHKPANLPNNSIVLAAVVATGTLFYFHEAPIEGLRPAIKEWAFHQRVSSQDIEARLWEDPFAAVAKSIDELDPSDPHHCKYPTEVSPKDLHCESPLASSEAQMVIGVTMPGAPYFEDGETRRRLRYAVLSGLDKAGFVPENPQHIGYFQPFDRALGTDPELPLPDVIPYEWFKRSSAEIPYEWFKCSSAETLKPILVLWLNEDIFAEKPLQKLS